MERNSKGQFVSGPRPELQTGKYIKCKICRKRVYVRLSLIDKKKYCSVQCKHKGWAELIKQRNWNKGKKLSEEHKQKLLVTHLGIPRLKNIKQKISQTLTGRKLSKTHIKNISGQNAYQWKDNNVSYGALHVWLKKQLGSPIKCSHCGLKGEMIGKFKKRWSIQWANIDHKYKRNLDDYIALCPPCHQKYDIINNDYVRFYARQ